MRPVYRTSFAPESDRRNHTMFSDCGLVKSEGCPSGVMVLSEVALSAS